jgi:hypothetical protein
MLSSHKTRKSIFGGKAGPLTSSGKRYYYNLFRSKLNNTSSNDKMTNTPG